MIRLIIFAITMLLLSAICNGQGRTSFGATRSQDTTFTKAQFKLEAYGGSLDTMLLIVLPNGDVKKVAVSSVVSEGWGLSGNALTGSEVLGSTNAQDLIFVTNNAEKMRLSTADGYLGLGTNSPTYQVHAKNSDETSVMMVSENNYSTGSTSAGFGGIVSSGARFLLRTHAGTWNGWGWQNNTVLGSSHRLVLMTDIDVASGGTNRMEFRVGGYDTTTEKARLLANGRFLLGTRTDNGTDLSQVNGSVYNKGITVDIASKGLGKVLTSDANGVGTWQAPTDTASLSTRIDTKLTKNGDSPTATISAGTNNSNAFNIETNNTTRASFMANGNILINDASSNGFDVIEIGGGRTIFTNNTNNNGIRIWFPSGTEPAMQITGAANTYIMHGTTLGATALNFYSDNGPSSTYAPIAAQRMLFPTQGSTSAASGTSAMRFNPSAPLTPGGSTIGNLYVDSTTIWYVNRTGRTGNMVGNFYGSAAGSTTISDGQSWTTYTGSGGHTFTLPAPRESRELKIKNRGSGTLTLSGAIYSNASVATYSLLAGEGIILISDGTDWLIVSKYVP